MEFKIKKFNVRLILQMSGQIKNYSNWDGDSQGIAWWATLINYFKDVC